MPRLRRLSGSEIVRILGEFGFVVAGTRGSHVKLVRTLSDSSRQTLHVPLHRELDTGTRRAIFGQACNYISPSELRPYFYSD